MAYRIITDSCCDFTKRQYMDRNVTYAPLSLHLGDETHPSFTEPEELHGFYDAVRGGAMPTTSAVNPEGWMEIMKPILDAGEDVLCLAFSSALSATCQSAMMAANELRLEYPDRKILVIDTLCAALGQGLLVDYACKKRDAGASLEEVAAWVEENKGSMAHWVTVDDLNHLKRGGRVSATTAFVGGLLGIKPIIHVDDNGKLDTVAKVRGRKAAMEYLVDKVRTTAKDLDTVFIAHGDCQADAEKLADMLKAIGVKEVTVGYVGGVVGAHTGPGVLVAFFLATER